MTLPDNISADYTLRPSELAEVLATLVKARQPTLVWGPPGAAKSMIARQVASDHGYNYVDIRALLLDPVDLRGIPWRDEDGRTRWAPPVFLPPTASTALWMLNLEELASCVPMVQAALYQLSLERKCGEYELPEGASIIACSNRANDRGIVHRMQDRRSSRPSLDPPGLLQPQGLGARRLPRTAPQTSASLPRRVRLSLQPTKNPPQRLQLALRPRRQSKTPYLQHVDQTGARCISGNYDSSEIVSHNLPQEFTAW